jgi:two-component sensor histidine kinase
LAADQPIKVLLENRNRLFWTLQLAGWAGYTLAGWLGALAHEKPTTYGWVIVVTAVSGLLLTSGMRYGLRWLWGRPPRIQAVGALAICYAVALPWKAFSNQAYWTLIKDGWTPVHRLDYVSGVTGAFYVLLCWTGLYFGIKWYLELQAQTERTLKATAAAHQAQLKMLRYQLNPHFLFNTLNAISTLILDQRNDLANKAVTRLSAFLRYTLDNDPMKKVSLGKELEALDLYLSIEKVRFGDRLRLDYDIEDQAREALVPSLILQPLVENALKYAVAPREEGGSIFIQAKVTGRTLHLVMADDGPGVNGNGSPKKSNNGVGLVNTRERLAQLYDDKHRFVLADNQPQGLLIRMDIPYEYEDSSTDR